MLLVLRGGGERAFARIGRGARFACAKGCGGWRRGFPRAERVGEVYGDGTAGEGFAVVGVREWWAGDFSRWWDGVAVLVVFFFGGFVGVDAGLVVGAA